MNRHWRFETDPDGIAWLHFNHADSPVNILSHEALEEFSTILDKCEKITLNGLVILSDKKSGFIAGADVKDFRDETRQEDAEAHILSVHKLFQRLEDLPFPTLALIHGFCLGGGLELALACTYRVAENSEKTRFAFPEVRLGLFPGYGGSVRSIERIGPMAAMRFMLAGRSIDSARAKKMGLVDQIAADRQMKAAAKDLLERRPAPQQARLLQRLLNWAPARHALAPLLSKKTAKLVNPDHYPAPFALIDHWKNHAGERAEMFASEAQQVSRLLTGETAQNLIRVFFLQERLKSLASNSRFTPRHVHVVGGGIMGGDIAAWCALKGLRVSLQDRKAQYLSNAVNRAHQLFSGKLKAKRQVQSAMDRLMPDPKGYAVTKADVVIEAIYEDATAKQELFREIEQQARPEALLATNTSSIPLDIISESLEHPERLIGLHFFNPVAKMQLLEIVHCGDSQSELVSQAAGFARSIDRLPLPVKSSPGFLVNRILMPYLLEAVELLEEGIPASLIDTAAIEFGMPMGPVELADRVGLDICLAVAEKLAPVYHLDIPHNLQTQVKRNHLGCKTGEGFYRYQKGKKVIERRSAQYHLPNDLTERMIFRLLNEAVACLREGVVEDPDLLDAGVIFGTGFAPFRGGPMHYIGRGGLDTTRRQLDELEQRHGSQFHPDAGWSSLSGV